MTIERKILFPFLVVVIVPIIVIGIVSYWTMFQSTQEQVFHQVEKTISEWFFISHELEGVQSEGKSNIKVHWLEENPEIKQIQKIENLSESSFLNLERLADGWYSVQKNNFWQEEWILLKTDPYTEERYFYQLTMDIWTESLLEIQKYTFLVVIIAGIIAVQLTIFFSHHIAKPIRQLAAYCQTIGTGSGRVPNLKELEERQDEIEVLATSLQDMVQALDRKNESLIRLKEFQDAILHSTLLGMYTIARDGQFLSHNQRWESFTKEFPQLPAMVHRWLLESQQQTNNADFNHEVVWQLVSPSGVKYLLLNKVPLVQESGEVVGVLCIVDDITEKKKMEVRMERVNRLSSLGELVAGLAHEIRNPLAGMKTTSQVLRKRLELSGQNETLFKTIEYEIDRLNSTLTSLLLFARFKEAEIQHVSVATVLAETLQILAKPLEEKQITVINQVCSTLQVPVDPDHLKQILLNLCMNAIKFMGEEGVLQFRSVEKDGKIKIYVQDNGSGMEEELKIKIFNPFFTTDPHGTGLGLSVVHQLIIQNEAEIDVESQQGKGTTFVLTFTGKERN